MNESVIIDAVRSPIGLKNGGLVGIRPDDLTAQANHARLASRVLNEHDLLRLCDTQPTW